MLAHLCSHVVTVERIPELAETASEAFAELGLRNVEVRTGDGSLGVPDRAPFDANRRDRRSAGRPTSARCSTSSRPARRWCARWSAAGTSAWSA